MQQILCIFSSFCHFLPHTTVYFKLIFLGWSCGGKCDDSPEVHTRQERRAAEFQKCCHHLRIPIKKALSVFLIITGEMEKLHRQITGTQRINQKVKLHHTVTVTSTQALITACHQENHRIWTKKNITRGLAFNALKH